MEARFLEAGRLGGVSAGYSAVVAPIENLAGSIPKGLEAGGSIPRGWEAWRLDSQRLGGLEARFLEAWEARELRE